jgi:hypothetical protein
MGLVGSLEAPECVVEPVEAASAEVLGAAAAAAGNSQILAVAGVVATESSRVLAADPESPGVLAAMDAAVGILAVDPELSRPLLAATEAAERILEADPEAAGESDPAEVD